MEARNFPTKSVLGCPAQRLFLAGLFATTAIASASAQEEYAARGAEPVSPERLLAAGTQAEADNWLMNHQQYSGNRYSLLEEITKENVGGLKLAFAVAIGGIENEGQLQGTPVVNDGFIYVTNAFGTVYKIDASSGTQGIIVWTMDPGVDQSTEALKANRGAALWQDLVISATIDGRLIATDDESGEIKWEVQIGTEVGESFTDAPMVIGDKVVIGQSAGDWGTRGWIAAYAADGGADIWKTYTIPAPGEPGAETWADDHSAWKTGGGAAWVTGTYDPELNLTYWGTGNPVPMFDPDYRPGDNLFTDSVLALNADTGAMEWYFQYTPGDAWDYDEEGVHQLYDIEIAGQLRKVVGHFGRNGFFYGFDRTNGTFLHANQYVDKVNWTAGIDPKTGKPVEYDPTMAGGFQPYNPEQFPNRENPEVAACPTIGGGVNYQPTAFSPRTGYVYGTGADGCSGITVEEVVPLGPEGGNPFGPGALFIGGEFESTVPLPIEEHGILAAVDATTGKMVANVDLTYRNNSGVLATAGGLVFTGLRDGWLTAYDDETLEELWKLNVGAAFKAPPISYGIEGRQFIAILAGHPRDDDPLPGLENMNPAHTLYVFGL